MLTRRNALLSALALAACGAPNSGGKGASANPGKKRIAITMDDFALPDDRAFAMERDARIRAALPVQAAGFVSGKYQDRPAFNDVLAAWATDGHLICNHSYAHANSSDGATDEIWADIARNHVLLKDRPGFAPYFRFPFLADGADRDQQAEYYARLAKAGYTPAPVTVDSFDWFVTDRMSKSDRPPALFGEYWVGATMMMAEYAHRLSGALGFTDLPHMLLVHHNALNALFLGDLIARLKDEGWEIIPAKSALDHPLYAEMPSQITAGRSLLSILKRERGLEIPEYPQALRKFGGPTMDALGL